jgi:hypothetical protein
VIIAFSVAGYYYVKSGPLLGANFQIANLKIDPETAELNQPINISVNVTNDGGGTGSYQLSLFVNDSLVETKDVQLASGETTTAMFTFAETTIGEYSVRVGDLTGSFIIQTSSMPSALQLSDLVITPSEGWADEAIKISVKATNVGSADISYPLPIKVNEVVRETKAVQLSGGASETVEFEVTEKNEGEYSANVGILTGKYTIVPNGKHTLIVTTTLASLGRIGSFNALPFTLNGESQSLPYTALADAGTYTITVLGYYEVSSAGASYRYTFTKWQDGSVDLTRTVNLQDYTKLVADYSFSWSCPSLYVWNGNSYAYSAEVSDGPGWLGWIDHYNQDGSIVFGYSYPWDYIKLDSSQTQPRNGYFDMIMAQSSDEIFYLDAAKLIVIDHSPDVDVYSTASTYKYSLTGQGTIFTVSKHPSSPVSAVNGYGENVLTKISKLDGVYTTGKMWSWNTLELNLGDLSNAKEINLIANGKTVWPTTQEGGEMMSNYVTEPGVTPQPPPYMEVKDAKGNWVPVPDNRQFPILDVMPETVVINMTGLFFTNDYSVRINTFAETRFDYIAVDTSSQENITVREIKPTYASLSQTMHTNSTSAGNFTRYGDILPLVLQADDKLVIGRQGDQVSLRFPANLGPVPKGMVRDFIFVANTWFKGSGLPYMSFTVDPLPFQAMSSYLYPPTESYPFDADHLSYLREYNTRIINNPR